MIYLNSNQKKEGKEMKRVKSVLFLAVFSVFAAAVFAGVTENAEGGFKGSVTDKVEKLMATNQDAERTYYPRDMRPNDLAIVGGMPLIAGVAYGYNINPNFQIALGAGAFFPGITADLSVKWFFMPTTITPYIAAGMTYVGALDKTVMAGHFDAGVDVALENALGINLGMVYMRSFSDMADPFKTAWGETNKIDNLGLQGGIHIRF
jgi:outer membrane protein W